MLDIINLGYVSDYVSRYDLRVKDHIGRYFDMASLEIQWAAEEQYDKNGVYFDIQPGFQENLVIVFDVAIDSLGFQLIPETEPISPEPNPTPTSTVELGYPGNTDIWEYTITDISTIYTLSGDSSTYIAKGMFLVIFATMKNISLEFDNVSRYDFVIQDLVTRQYDMAPLEVQWAAEDQYNRTGVYETIQPSFTEDQVYVFDILSTASGLFFVPTDPGTSVDLGR